MPGRCPFFRHHFKGEARRLAGCLCLTGRKPLPLSFCPPLPFTTANMESVLIAAVLAAAQPHAPVGDAANALDQRCFSLMAQLAEDQDPRVQSLGRVAAQYFLGRIDAASPGFDPASAVPPGPGDRTALLR